MLAFASRFPSKKVRKNIKKYSAKILKNIPKT
jgi:hypothetical protein